MWAFVSDFARLKVVYDNGGIYLDTDVILKNNLDDLLMYDAWFAQDDIRWINTGLGFGAKKDNKLIGKILESRSTIDFDYTICNAIDTPIIRAFLNCKQSRESQCINNILIVGMVDYPKYAQHLETNSWKTEEEFKASKARTNKYWKLKCFLRNPNLINRLERKGPTKISKLYVFLAYDFLDNGCIYFLKRCFKRFFH